MRDRFFFRDADSTPEPEEPTRADLVRKLHAWDGQPIVRLTYMESISLWEHVPHWTARMVGPRLPWVGEAAVVDVGYLVLPTYREAEVAVIEKTHEACVAEGLPWDEDEWRIVRLTLDRGN